MDGYALETITFSHKLHRKRGMLIHRYRLTLLGLFGNIEWLQCLHVWCKALVNPFVWLCWYLYEMCAWVCMYICVGLWCLSGCMGALIGSSICAQLKPSSRWKYVCLSRPCVALVSLWMFASWIVLTLFQPLLSLIRFDFIAIHFPRLNHVYIGNTDSSMFF